MTLAPTWINMDRSVLENDPHRVLEGMAIAGYAVGADRAFIYVRAEYPVAVSRLQTAIRQAKQHGLLGSAIFESTFYFNVDIRGAGAFVCGEETALMASIEGNRSQPRHNRKSPFVTITSNWVHNLLAPRITYNSCTKVRTSEL